MSKWFSPSMTIRRKKRVMKGYTLINELFHCALIEAFRKAGMMCMCIIINEHRTGLVTCKWHVNKRAGAVSVYLKLIYLLHSYHHLFRCCTSVLCTTWIWFCFSSQIWIHFSATLMSKGHCVSQVHFQLLPVHLCEVYKYYSLRSAEFGGKKSYMSG